MGSVEAFEGLEKARESRVMVPCCVGSEASTSGRVGSL